MSSPLARPAIPEPRRKRLKIDVACDTCRSRKVKCDGVRPACGNCARRLDLRGHCTYSGSSSVTLEKTLAPRRDSSTILGQEPSPHRGSNHSETDPSHETNALEQAIAFLGPTPSQVQPMQSTTGPRHGVDPLPAHSPPKASPGQQRIGELQGDPRSSTQVDTSPSVIDSMTTAVDQGFVTREYFGSSSAGSFTAQIKSAIDARLGEQGHGPPRNNKASLPKVSSATFESTLDPGANYVLPPRRQADHLVSLYWFYVDPLYPFIDREKWSHSYNGLFAGTSIDADERLFIATLNAVFALSTQLLEGLTPDQREETSNSYFRRARDLLHLTIWDSGSVELVQCLLLASQYLQSTNHPHQTWMVVGSAIRVAQGLGLHLPDSSAEIPDLHERELLRRIWHGCVLMDRIVSTTHGRPVMIPSQQAAAVPLPISCSDQSPGVQLVMGNDITHASFFVKSLELYEIIHRSILTLYSGTSPHSMPKETPGIGPSEDENEEIGTVMKLDRCLSKWKHSLPDHLQIDNPKAADTQISHRQSVILRIRFLHARILLLRPILARFCLSYSPSDTNQCDDNLQSRVMQQCAMFCVSTAQQIIALLLKHQTDNGTVGLLPAWWYRVYYVYSAATVLIAARLRPAVFSSTDVGRAWSQAMSVLQNHERFGQSARRCVAALHILSSKILQDVSATGINNPRPSDSSGNNEDAIAGGPGQPESQPNAIDIFAVPSTDFDELDLANISFDVNDFSWLNDVHAWELLNES